MYVFQPNLSRLSVRVAMLCAYLAVGTMAPSHASHESVEDEPEATEPSPTVPRLSVPEYRSPLSNYKPYEEGDSPGWKALNDRVGEIGGWRSYAREAYESDDTEKDSQ